MVDTTRLAPRNPIAIASFLLVEFQNVTHIDQFYAHFGAGNFVDVTSESIASGEWAALELTAREAPHLLAFIAGDCNGELELIFSAGRLVQAGFLLVGELPQTPFLQAMSEALSAILSVRYSVAKVSPTHTIFSDNILNGYLHTPDPARLAFRVTELKWCEAMYGPAFRTM